MDIGEEGEIDQEPRRKGKRRATPRKNWENYWGERTDALLPAEKKEGEFAKKETSAFHEAREMPGKMCSTMGTVFFGK